METVVVIVWGTVLATECDVGASAGYYGCLGGVIASLPTDRRPTASALVMMFLLGRLWLSVGNGWSMTSDIAHLIAFRLGMIVSPRLFGTEPCSQSKLFSPTPITPLQESEKALDVSATTKPPL